MGRPAAPFACLHLLTGMRFRSAWNWCSKIEKKKYFNLFLLTGFAGFDGKFYD